MAKNWVQNPWRNEVAIDMGTAFVRVATEKFGVKTIPTTQTGRSPLRDGVVTDRNAAASLLWPWLAKAKRLGLFNPRVLVGVPTDATDKEQELLTEALYQAGAVSVSIVSEPFAAALGAGLNILSPFAQMVVDVGEGVTDCAILRGGHILESHATRIGCSSFRERVQDNFRQCWGGFDLNMAEAERIIAVAGTERTWLNDVSILVKVLSVDGAKHEPLPVRPATLQAMIEPLVLEITGTAINLLRKVPPAVGCEIIESGIVLTGGGAMLPGLRERLAKATSIKVTIPTEPLDVVIKGLRGMLRRV